MKEVNVSKDALLATVKENRQAHEQEFEQASAGWRARVEQHIRGELAKLVGEDDDTALEGSIKDLFNLKRPTNHLDEYDQVIQMLEYSLDDEVVVSWDEFQQYVMDRWEWSRAWHISNSGYVRINRA